MAAGNRTRFGGGALNVGFVTGSLDGKPVAPLLPNFKEYSRRSRIVNTGFMTSNLQCYDDHIAAVRFTPRDVMLTDVEIFWLVRADAKEGRDFKADRLTALIKAGALTVEWRTKESSIYAAPVIGGQSGTPIAHVHTDRRLRPQGDS